MDGFKSIVIHVSGDELKTVGDITSTTGLQFEELFESDNILFDAGSLGWGDGGLERALGHVLSRGPMYFRGHALFDNPDDAKNDYLMNPEMHDDCKVEVYGDVQDDHIPWGMVIPNWSISHDTIIEDGRHTLNYVTILLFWQEQ